MKNPAHKLHSLLPSTVSQIRERETRFNEDNIYNFNYKPEHFRIRCEWQPPCSNLKKWQCCYNLLTSLLQSLLRTHVVDKLWDLYVRSTTLTFFVLVVSEDLVGQGELTTSSASQIFHDRRSWTRWKNRIFKWFSRTDNCRFTSNCGKILISETRDDSSCRRNFDLDKKNETITIAGKSILKWVKLQSFVANCCKLRKI